MIICLERGADLHMAQLMPLPLTVSCFSKIQVGLPFWYRLTRVVPDKGPLNGCVCVCVCVCVLFTYLQPTGIQVARLTGKTSHSTPNDGKLSILLAVFQISLSYLVPLRCSSSTNCGREPLCILWYTGFYGPTPFLSSN